MKIASKKPEAIRTNVYVTGDTYECWYAEPVSLGKIHKRGDYWYTADGHRHASSRDALNYLISHTTVTSATNVKAGKIPEARAAVPKEKILKQATAVPEPPTASVNQNHPRFQEYLDFVDFMARRKARSFEGASTSSHGAAPNKGA